MKKIHRPWFSYLLIANLFILVFAFSYYFQARKSSWETPKPFLINFQLPEKYKIIDNAENQVKNKYVDISLEKPIFYINRKMPLPPVVNFAKELPKDQWQDGQLLGIYRGSVSGAILLYGGVQKRLAVGDQIDGWILKSLYSDSIEIEKDGVFRKIDLKKANLEKK